jgi:hypothetical protein
VFVFDIVNARLVDITPLLLFIHHPFPLTVMVRHGDSTIKIGLKLSFTDVNFNTRVFDFYE